MKTRKSAALVLFCLILGLTWGVAASSANLELYIPRVKTAPEIDGKLDDAAWLNASIKGGKFVVDVNDAGSVLTPYPRVGYVCYDDNAIYFGVTVFAPDATKLEGSMSSWWDNDEVEVFLDPNQKGNDIQFGVTAGGFVSSDAIQAASSKDGIRWVVEIAVPWAAVNASAPKAGDKWGVNICGHQVAYDSQWLAYNCTFGGFHNPSKSATGIFGE